MSLALVSLFSLTINATVVLNLTAIAPRVSPGITVYDINVPGGTFVETAVAVGSSVLGAGIKIF